MKFLGRSRKKNKEDITAMTEAQRALESAMEAVVAYLRSANSPTSEAAHQIIDEVLAEQGCESPEGYIVAGGKQSAEPHEKGSGPLEEGVPIVIDIYPRSQKTGFFADMTRTVCIGQPPTGLQKMYDTVLQAQELALAMVKPGALCADIQKAVEQYFIGAGYQTSGQGKEFRFAEGFVHSVGHGVGQEIHEKPFLGRDSKDILKEGDVITIEPGLYYPELGGVRLEDMVLVTPDGHENFSNFPKQFVL